MRETRELVATKRSRPVQRFDSYQLFGAVSVISADSRVRRRACEELLFEIIAYTRPRADIAQR